MGASDLIQTWQDMKGKMRRGAFERAHPHPFLWVYMERDPDTDVGFVTGIRSVDDPDDEIIDGPGEVIVPVKNAGRGPFVDRIMVGRSRNCDIIISASSISKLHAVFRETTPNAARLADRNSKNGTTVNGVRIEPGSETDVKSGDELTFGLVTAAFLSAGDLYDRL